MHHPLNLSLSYIILSQSSEFACSLAPIFIPQNIEFIQSHYISRYFHWEVRDSSYESPPINSPKMTYIVPHIIPHTCTLRLATQQTKFYVFFPLLNWSLDLGCQMSLPYSCTTKSPIFKTSVVINNISNRIFIQILQPFVQQFWEHMWLECLVSTCQIRDWHALPAVFNQAISTTSRSHTNRAKMCD